MKQIFCAVILFSFTLSFAQTNPLSFSLPVLEPYQAEWGETLEPKTLKPLTEWSRLFTGQWDAVLLMPREGSGQGVILTAWGKKLSLVGFDEAAAAAFIDAFRGRGPENPVR